MRLLVVLILGIGLGAGYARAQEEDYSVDGAANALQSVLTTMKESARKLSLDNNQLAVRDQYMQTQITQLQLALGQLQAQGQTLKAQTAPLQAQNEQRTQEANRLEQVNFDLDDRIQKEQTSIKMVQQSMEAEYSENQRLLLQLKSLSSISPALPAQPVQSAAAAAVEKDKLKLMKMIEDCQQRQESLHEAILEAQKKAPILPAAGALAHQALLKQQIKELETEVAAYPQENLPTQVVASRQWDDTQLEQMELELKALGKNYMQLKDLMAQMQKRANASRPTVGQQLEEKKLRGSINDLNRQSEGLRAQLDDLRSQMVDLDKRKSRLEEMIRHLP